MLRSGVGGRLVSIGSSLCRVCEGWCRGEGGRESSVNFKVPCGLWTRRARSVRPVGVLCRYELMCGIMYVCLM